MPRRAGLKAVVSHGRGDPLLPFQAAEGLVGMLRAAAWDVTFVPFAGGHAIPFEALAAAAKLISEVTDRSPAASTSRGT
jgi:phospholipase/carboxylesterase